jgi:hypothetical protein
VIRRLADRWMELASQPVMAERKRQWTALKDLRAERPMVLFETWSLLGYVADDELECSEPWLRGMEKRMRWTIRQAEEVGDDIVLEPCWRMGWHVTGTGWGVEIPSHNAIDESGDCVGYRFDHPIRTPQDIYRLTPQTWTVDRKATHESCERTAEVLGDAMPVALHGTEGMHAGLTGDLFRLMGNDRLLTWVYDEPEAIHRLMAFLRDDRLACYAFMEREGLLGLNNHWTFVGSGSPGYTTALPQADYAGKARLKDLWVWIESQEAACISPSMFVDFFLPYLAEVAAKFGLVYYGCCEPVHDRWRQVVKAIPHVRAASVSPWCDKPAIAEMLGRTGVFSRKPRPAPISGPSPDWEALEEDLVETVRAARGCCLELIFRDVYRIHGDRPRLRRWTELARDVISREYM